MAAHSSAEWIRLQQASFFLGRLEQRRPRDGLRAQRRQEAGVVAGALDQPRESCIIADLEQPRMAGPSMPRLPAMFDASTAVPPAPLR